MNDAQPPRLSQWLLRQLVSARLADEVLADLGERYRRRVADDGRRAARWWYRRQVLGTLAPSGIAAGPGLFDGLLDFRQGARKLVRKPAVAAALILSLAIGIGANAAIFSVVNGVLLRPLPYPEPETLVQLRTELPLQGRGRPVVSGPELLDLRAGTSTLASLGGIWFRPGALTDDAAEPEDIGMAFVTAGFLETLGVGPAIGRWPAPAEDVSGAEKVILLADSLWQRRYGGDPNIVGKRIEFDGVAHTVIGVMPASFQVLLAPDAGIPADLAAWVPFGGSYDEYPRNWRVLTVVGRLAPSVPLEAAAAQLQELAAGLRTEHASDYAGSGLGFRIQQLGDDVVTNVRPLLLLLLGAVGLMLLIVCANSVNLLLAGMTAARQELAVRSALGATRGRLVRQLAAESMLVVALGAGGGVLLARWGVATLPLLAPEGLPRGQDIQLDLGVLAYVAAISVFTAMVFGTFSGLHVRRQGDAMLRSGGRSPGDASGGVLRSGLVVFEVALCLMLLIGVGLMTQSFAGLVRQDPGFDSDGVLTVKLSLVDDSYPYAGPAKIARFYQQLEDLLSQSAGIDAAGGTTLLPLDGDSVDPAPYAFETPSGPTEWGSRSADQRVVTPGFLEALGARLLAGRFLSPADNLDAPLVVIVDETMAAAAWPGESALGKRVQLERFLNGAWNPEWAEVVGVVQHLRQNPGQRGIEQIFVAHPQVPMRTITMAIRSDLDPDSLLRTVTAATAAIDSQQPVQTPVAMGTYLAESVSKTRFAMTLLALFSTVALVLALLGTYGVISYTVSQRTRELGIAMALGASPRHVMGNVLSRGVRLAAAGIALGLVGAVGLSRFLAGLLYGVGATDPRTFLAVTAMLAAVALVACYVPARRAARLDPSAALRTE